LQSWPLRFVRSRGRGLCGSFVFAFVRSCGRGLCSSFVLAVVTFAVVVFAARSFSRSFVLAVLAFAVIRFRGRYFRILAVIVGRGMIVMAVIYKRSSGLGISRSRKSAGMTCSDDDELGRCAQLSVSTHVFSFGWGILSR
jgi:hypothetical protein